jgi:hypothetical protein
MALSAAKEVPLGHSQAQGPQHYAMIAVQQASLSTRLPKSGPGKSRSGEAGEYVCALRLAQQETDHDRRSLVNTHEHVLLISA